MRNGGGGGQLGTYPRKAEAGARPSLFAPDSQRQVSAALACADPQRFQDRPARRREGPRETREMQECSLDLPQ
jgi:hypothetical protein